MSGKENPWQKSHANRVDKDSKHQTSAADAPLTKTSVWGNPTKSKKPHGDSSDSAEKKSSSPYANYAKRKTTEAQPSPQAEKVPPSDKKPPSPWPSKKSTHQSTNPSPPSNAPPAETSRPAKASKRKMVSPRLLAAQLIARMWEGKSLSELLKNELKNTTERDRPLAAELTQGVARWGYRLRALAARLLDHPIKDKNRDVEALLLVGLYQLEYSRIPAHAAVSETVNAASGFGKPWARGLVNGVLRNYQRQGAEQLKLIDEDDAFRHAHPFWLTNRLKEAWPEDWETILANANQRPPMSLRINRNKVNRKQYATQLSEAGMPCRPLPETPDGLKLDSPTDVWKLPGFGQGLVSVQDGGAQLAALLLNPEVGHLTLDACAAPGGKTCHLLEIQPGVKVTAMDKEEGRLKRLHENLQRLGLTANVVVGDAAEPEGDWAQDRYARILLDVPCSATGVIRRHPDIKWLKRDKDIAGLVQQQRKILDAMWQLLEVEGILLYATCSILPEENRLQVESFLQDQADAKSIPIIADWGREDGVGRQILPGEGGMDGFYYALLQKKSLPSAPQDQGKSV